MQGVFLDSFTVDWGDIDFSGLASTLSEWTFYPSTSPEMIQERIASANIVITNKVRLSSDIIRSALNLQCICIAATGVDGMALEAARERGIVVCNAVNYSTASVVQHTIGLMINLASRLIDYCERVNDGDWVNSALFCMKAFRTQSLENKILGIIGYGAIGRGVAKVAEALGMIVKTRLPLSELLPQVDFLTLHCPLTPQTERMINEKTLAMMKPGACIINTARGGLIDEEALAKSLLSGHLGGAALDVLSLEPPQANNPLLQTIPNLIVTPHIAWATREARQRLVLALEENVRAFLAGEPIHVVN